MPAQGRILFLNDHLLTPHDNIPDSGILCENERIIATGGASAFVKEPGLEVIEMPDAFAVPGLIDCHVHGAGGFDASNAWRSTSEDLDRMSVMLAKHGVTSFLPTLVSGPRDIMIRNVAALAEMLRVKHSGAEPVGINIEGPFINPEKAGTQDDKSICPIDLKFAEELIAAGGGRIKLMTFAPELDNSEKLIELLLNNGVIPSMGHSLATGAQAERAIDAGACHCTHLFNGMPQLHQRSYDITLAVLTDNRVSVELIADGGHLHPRMVDLAGRVKPHDKIIGISNGIDPTVKDGSISGGTIVKNEDGVVTQNGVIAGTTTTLEMGWLHLINYSRLPATLAAACFSANPARDLGLITRGELRPGKKADITFFDCSTNTVVMTVVRGRIVYKAEALQ